MPVRNLTEKVNDSPPQKDRRAMLEEWRKQTRARESTPSTSSTSNKSSNSINNVSTSLLTARRRSISADLSSRGRFAAPLPSQEKDSGFSTMNIDQEGLTAVERFRIRRQKRLMESNNDGHSASKALPPQPPIQPAMTRSSICFDDFDEDGKGNTNLRAGPTPKLSRRLTMTSGPRRRATKGRKSMQFVPQIYTKGVQSTGTDSTEADSVNCEQPKDEGSQCQQNSDIEGPGLRSKVVAMEKRIQDLEAEKMTLSMSKAPLEARLRQKEDQWTKEKTRYEQEIYALKANYNQVGEQLKNLEMQHEELHEESKRLRFEARQQKAASTLDTSNISNDVWNSQLQNDRDASDHKEKLRHAEEDIKSLKLEKLSVEAEAHATNTELRGLRRDFAELKADYDEMQEQKELNIEAEIQLQELTKEHAATTAQLNATSGELASLKSQSKFDVEKKEQLWLEEKEKLLFEMSVVKSRAATSNNDSRENSSIDSDVEDEAVLRARIEERDRRIMELEAEILKGEQIRRKMHNRIQELRGNIRVFVRTRPFLPGDSNISNSSIEVHPDGESLTIMTNNIKKNALNFKYDKVFAPSAGQECVFNEVSEFVQSALDGYNVCLFSYGQTGSGKTHTMQGSGNGAMRGIIPRAVEQILSQAKRMVNQKWKFKMTASLLEIYNEELKDLLVAMKEDPAGKSKQSKLAIRRDRGGKSYVDGLRKIDIDAQDCEKGMQTLKRLLSSAARARSVACTNMNSNSSRSHSVFMLHLEGVNEDSCTVVEGSLNLCDLAGSERLDRSGVSMHSQRLKETQAINKSLSCLGDVFNSLANGSSHVPFRNSKLTYLLQDCLSGDGKALMFVNLSPTLESSSESICSLRFAQRVNQVELGKATKHIEHSGKMRM